MLELTESLLVDDSDAAIDGLLQLRGLGVHLALDDFGTGCSSLARLSALPIDEMKSDKSFVDRIDVHPHNSRTVLAPGLSSDAPRVPEPRMVVPGVMPSLERPARR